MIKRVCVFCGSSSGADPIHLQTAQHTGAFLAAGGLDLVYGGGSLGLMGAVADAALSRGGTVIGIIPEALMLPEVAHEKLSQRHVVPDMHTRKALMGDLSDAFLILPGGLGTLEELFEVWSWAMLGIHRKPVGILNVKGYYTPLLSMMDQMADQGFIPPRYRDLLAVAEDPPALIEAFHRYQPPPTILPS